MSNRELYGLYVVAGLLTLGVGAVFALLAELQDAHDLPTAGLGLISGMSFLAALVVQLTMARFADRGHGSMLLRLSVVGGSASLVWTGFATELWQFVAARALLGAAMGLFLPPARRAIIVTSSGRQAERLGVLYGAYLGGFLVGPPVAAILAGLFGTGPPFVMLGAFMLLGLPAVATTSVPAADAAIVERRVLRLLIRRRAVVGAILVVISFRFSIGVFEPLWARFLTDVGATTLVIGLSLTVFAAPMIVIASFGGRLADRHGARWASLIAAAATVPFMASYGFTASVPLLLVLAVAHGVGEAVESPGSQAAVADASPAEHTAAAQGLAEAFGSAAAAFGAFTAAPVYAALGARATWVLAAGFMAGCLALSAAIDRPVRSSRVSEQVGTSPA